jgi:hypothetical protein
VLEFFVVVDGVDRNLTRLQGFWNLTQKVDLEHAVFERSTFHLDVLGQIELTPERTPRDALVKIPVRALAGLATFNGQHVLLRGDGDLIR